MYSKTGVKYIKADNSNKQTKEQNEMECDNYDPNEIELEWLTEDGNEINEAEIDGNEINEAEITI